MKNYKLTQEQIKEIAENLDCGFRCFWSKTNGELLFFMNNDDIFGEEDEELDETEEENWDFSIEEKKKIRNDPDDYEEIRGLESYESFNIMEEFIDTLSDSNKLKNRLINALAKRKPFSNFKYEIDNSGDYRQEWFDFKKNKMEEWVKERFKEIIEEIEFKEEREDEK